MTQEDKQVLLKDLCARLPYGAKVHTWYNKPIDIKCTGVDVYTNVVNLDIPEDDAKVYIDNVKPYLRPMSSMTQEERDEIEEMSHGWFYVNEDGEIFPVGQLTDSGEFEDAILPTLEWLNKKMFDYRGLIPMGLALEAPKGMYKTE